MIDIAVQKTLPKEITSYDLIKAFAVIIMVIDHMGYYFFPEILWLRAVGRIGFPIWFFLAGYSSGKGISPKLLIGAVVLLVANFVTGMPMFPLNALFTIILIRLSIDYFMRPVVEGRISVWPVALILLALVKPSYAFCEYGTQAMITAVFGYLVRHRAKLENENLTLQYMVFAFVTFIAVQQYYFDFSWAQFAVMVLGTLAIRSLLYNFKPISYKKLSALLPNSMKFILQFMGRRTLEIYVVHLILFKSIDLYMGDGRFELFRFALTQGV